MEADENRVEVQVGGETYVLKGKGNPNYLKELARYVDATMQMALQRNPRLSVTEAAVLAALNVADLYFTSKWEEIDRKQNQQEQEGDL